MRWIPASDTTYGQARVLRPERSAYATVGVIWASGILSSMRTALQKGNGVEEFRIIEALAKTFTVVVCDNAGSVNWGNATGVAAMTYNRSLLTAQGCTGRTVVCGMSMGHSTVVQWAAANPGLVRAVVGFILSANLTNVRVDDNGLRGSVDSAWGVTYPAALPANSSPHDRAATLAAASVPWRGYAGTADATLRYADAQAFASAVQGTLVSTAGGGHGDTTLSTVDVDVLTAWILGTTA